MPRFGKPWILNVFLVVIVILCTVTSFVSMIGEVNKVHVEETLHRTKREVDDKFMDEVVQLHNTLRAKHGSPPLTIDKSLCPATDEWTKKLIEDSEKNGKMMLAHSRTKDVGENVAMCKCKDFTANKSVMAWYDEINKFNFSDNKFALGTGHFTQLIWKATTHICVARHIGKTFVAVVAQYKPRGNMNYVSAFAANVLPPK